MTSVPTRSAALFVAALCTLLGGCAPSVGALSASRPPLVKQWFERAKASYRAADFDDARDAVQHALAGSPNDPEIRELSGRIALVRLDYAEALRVTEGVDTTDAHGVRGRAFWFSGDLEHAADELEAMLTDPKVKDSWAKDVAGLARRGAGRHPFEMEGHLIAGVDMPRALDRVALGAANVVPCELDGERILALVATGASDVFIDSNSRHEAAWVSLKFDRMEIKDVPALVMDLSPISRQVGVPIKALLGVQLLRHGHVTFDRRGDQFVVRRQEATPPPDASRVPLYYVRGGGMLLRASLGPRDEEAQPFLVDSAKPFPLMLQDTAWQKVGVDPRTLMSEPDAPNVKRGTVPTFRLGGFDLAKMPAFSAPELAEVASGVDIDLAGVVGADLLSFFRITFADDGRFMWIEPDPSLLGAVAPAPRATAVPPSTTSPTGSGLTAPSAAAPAAGAQPARTSPPPAASGHP